ncbi:glu S.griseus protease inhibitor-like [Elaeis guineensis]|uniref:Glu S.griseus protease inhibitor-like n=1 Tax=Elaeis guineensis var. tenera TaxID=51953 RepID=A0A6I9S3T4_ELAGV|nr:glu S.griseus protease inhibitor-like [Elaeis guineensis]
MECTGKSSWPELVGVNGKEAEKIIEKENPAVDAIIVMVGESVVLNFSCERVWVWVDKDGIVAQVPKIG